VNAVLFFATIAAGALNAVAGGGSFLTLPALLFAGVPPVAANATSTLAAWPASLASAVAYRRELGAPATWASLGVVSLVGGLLGGVLLVKTSDASFMRLLPPLMLLAAVTFSFGNRVTRRFNIAGGADPTPWWMYLLQLAIATYGGYFGGGMNAVALAIFIAHRAIVWRAGLIMAAGGVVGGYWGAEAARRLNRDAIRVFVIGIAWTMTAYFFVR
jgi:hypothetical protein